MKYIDFVDIDFHISRNKAEFAETAALFFVERAQESIKERGEFIVALSGGSTPAIVLDVLAMKYHGTCEWDKIHLFWSDERFVPNNDERSNFYQSKVHLLDKVKIPPENIYPVPTEYPVEQAAKLYQNLIGRWPRFDLVFLGLGEDGHTASLFPGSPALKNDKELVVAVKLPELPEARITFTYPIINSSRCVVVLVKGEEKREIVQKSLTTAPMAEKLPIQGVHPKDGKLVWILDEEAAGELYVK